MSNQTSEKMGRFEVRATAESHFSWLRTRMSTERTIMSWIRTATALIGFGFTIVQFLEHLNHMEGVAPAHHPQAPRYLGLMLIGAGVVGSVVSLWEYRKLLRYLWSAEFAPIAGIEETPAPTLVPAIALVILLIGLFAFFAVLLRF